MMSNCDDEVSILQTYSDASSIEILAFDGNDRIVLGDVTQSFDTGIHANIIVDAGKGPNDILSVADGASTAPKVIAVRPTTLSGIHGDVNRLISYFSVETLNISLGTADAEVNVLPTVKEVPLIMSTQGKLLSSDSQQMNTSAFAL